jgi:hypothetical protein
MLGTAAVAAIVRRAVGHAAADGPELVDLVVRRENFQYRYVWSTQSPPSLGGDE